MTDYNNIPKYAESIARRSLSLTTHTVDNVIYFSDTKRIYPNFAMYIDSDIQKEVDKAKQELKKKYAN